MVYNKEYNVYLPEKSDLKYWYIENYEDYEYANCIAYEMMIRTDKFQKIKNIKLKDRDENWIKGVEELGLNSKITSFPEELHELIPISENNLLHEHWFSYTINEVDNGLHRLIIHYINNKKIHPYEDVKKSTDNTKSIHKKTITDTTLKLYAVIKNLEYYSIPTNDGRLFPLNKTIPLKILEKEFLATLYPSDIETRYIQTEPIFNRPTLRFKQCKIINLPVNLNLSKDELVAYMEKIKNDYDEENSIIQNHVELLGEELDKATVPPSIKKLPSNKDLRKAKLSEAFFIFDLYKILTPIFKSKKDSIKKKRDTAIKEIRRKKNT